MELLRTYFLQNPRVSRFVTLILEVIDKRKLYLWQFWKFVLHPLEIPHFFLITPGYSACTHYFFNTPGNSMLSTPCIYFWNNFSRFCKKVFFLIIPTGSLGIPLPILKETNVQSSSKINVGNHLVGEISRNFFYIAFKGQNLPS